MGEKDVFETSPHQWVIVQIGPRRPRLAQVSHRVRLSFDTWRIWLWNHDEIRLNKNLETWNVKFMRAATVEDLDRYRVPQEQR